MLAYALSHPTFCCMARPKPSVTRTLSSQGSHQLASLQNVGEGFGGGGEGIDHPFHLTERLQYFSVGDGIGHESSVNVPRVLRTPEYYSSGGKIKIAASGWAAVPAPVPGRGGGLDRFDC